VTTRAMSVLSAVLGLVLLAALAGVGYMLWDVSIHGVFTVEQALQVLHPRS
jgi:hypothetical protein